MCAKQNSSIDQEVSHIQELALRVRQNVEKVIVGKQEVIDMILMALIAQGHILLEDVPGTGKTKLARSIAKSIDADFKRVQFTADLLPSDLTGIHFFNQKHGEFIFRPGPLFTNILLADEINRATARTQSSLLECMEERQITVDGISMQLDRPFLVIATQNPVETQGTFPLPEAQLDRFLIRLAMGYPDHEDGRKILTRFQSDDPFTHTESVCTKEELILAQDYYQHVYICDAVLNYLLTIIEATRKHESILLGVSPRGSLALMKSAQAYAAIHGRSFVTPDDIKTLLIPVLAHRLLLRTSSSFSMPVHLGQGAGRAEELLLQIASSVPCPTENFTEI